MSSELRGIGRLVVIVPKVICPSFGLESMDDWRLVARDIGCHLDLRCSPGLTRPDLDTQTANARCL